MVESSRPREPARAIAPAELDEPIAFEVRLLIERYAALRVTGLAAAIDSRHGRDDRGEAHLVEIGFDQPRPATATWVAPLIGAGTKPIASVQSSSRGA